MTTHQKLTYSIPEVCIELNLCRQSVYHEINAGRLSTYRVGTRRFVSRRALEAYVADREAEAAPGVA